MEAEWELKKNTNGRWQYGERELTCGDVVEIELGGNWICGRIEHTPSRGYFFLIPAREAQTIGVLYDHDGAAVLLNEGMWARNCVRGAGV